MGIMRTTVMVPQSLVYNAVLVERIDVTDGLGIFRIDPDEAPETPWFKAGQYCVLGLNNTARRALGSVKRPMSIASAPELFRSLEFYIRRVDRPRTSNPLTPLLWKLKPGERLYMSIEPAGTFTLDKILARGDSRMLVMVAAGTGVAPFMSMIRSEVCRNPAADLSKWVLVHGASTPAALGYRQELLQMAETQHLKFCATISRPATDSNWPGHTGRVESFFESDRLRDFEEHVGLAPNGLNPEQAVILVCGSSGTIVNTINSLIDRGFVPNLESVRHALGISSEVRTSLYVEHYDHAPMIEVSHSRIVESLDRRPPASGDRFNSSSL